MIYHVKWLHDVGFLSFVRSYKGTYMYLSLSSVLNVNLFLILVFLNS